MSDYQKLLKLYNEIDELIKNRVDADNKTFKIWKSKVKLLLAKIFGEKSSELYEFKRFSFTLTFAFGHESDEEYIKRCCDDLRAVKPIIENFLEVIKEEDDVAVYVADASMKKKYQVFISSTYTDLVEERMAATQCLLDNDCIPVGMEQFPAAGMSQMEYIKKILDDCDYYILILAGRYGSLDTDGMGFTEKEYDYAVSKNIPIMCFLINDTGMLPYNKCEQDDAGKNRLLEFRKKVSTNRLVKMYSNIGELKAGIVTSVNMCIKNFPAAGWVRGFVPGKKLDTEDEVLKVLEKLTITKEEIDAMFEQKLDPITKNLTDVNTKVSSMRGIRVGKEVPTNLQEGELFIQVED